MYWDSECQLLGSVTLWWRYKPSVTAHAPTTVRWVIRRIVTGPIMTNQLQFIVGILSSLINLLHRLIFISLLNCWYSWKTNNADVHSQWIKVNFIKFCLYFRRLPVQIMCVVYHLFTEPRNWLDDWQKMQQQDRNKNVLVNQTLAPEYIILVHHISSQGQSLILQYSVNSV